MLTFNFKNLNINSKNTKALDIGCGEGRHTFGLMEEFPDLECYGVDMSEKSLKKSLEGLEYFKSISNNKTVFSKASAYKLPFMNSTFDVVICSEVLEHLIDYKDAIKEIKRVAKKNAIVLISVPTYLPEKICWILSEDYKNMPGGHVRIFKIDKLIDDFTHSGFTLYRKHKSHSIHSPYWWLRCMFWDTQEQNSIIKIYKKILEKHILEKPIYIDIIDKLFNPLFGKSTSLYFKSNELD